MTFINPIFNTKKVKDFVRDLIISYGYEDLDDVSFQQKCEFAALLIEAANDHDCITQSPNFNQFFQVVIETLNGEEYQEKLGESLIEMIVRYYTPMMKIIFFDGAIEYQQNCKEWLNYTASFGDPDDAYDRARNDL